MDRRGFLKNSIGALLFAGLTSNKVLAEVVETLTPNSPKVLLYLIQLKTGEWKIRTTKWVDIPTKRLNEPNIVKHTFKPIDVVDINQVVSKRLHYWKEYKCSGRMGSLVSLGIPMTEEMKEEYSEFSVIRHTGVKRSVITRKRISEKRIGKPSPNLGKVFTEEVRKRMSKGGKGKKYSDTHKEKLRIRMLTNNPFKGKKHSEKTLSKIKDKHPSKIIKVCEHCGKKLTTANYSRYHGEKCKVITGKSNVSEQQKSKIREKLVGRTFGKSVSCFSHPSMIHYKDYPNLTEAIKELNLNRECARLTCVGKRDSVGNFTFRYKT